MDCGWRDIINRLLTTILATVLLSACSVIDEDLSDCGNDYKLDYELRLVTNMTTELHTQLGLETNVALAAALKEHLSGIFTDYAHDVDLSFYDTQGEMLRLQHDQHIMDANQASYTLYLPMRQYMHLAVANVLNNQLVTLNGDEKCRTAILDQTANDTIASHTTGIFTARQPMDVLEGVDQTFNVHLYMANCAAALVIDPRGHDVSSLKVFAKGFASEFNINDSTYHFAAKDPIVRTNLVQPKNSTSLCYCSVNFPSREPENLTKGTRSVVETTEPFDDEACTEPVWEFKTYITNEDGTVTETILGIRKTLRAGQLMIINGYISDDGSVQTDDQMVGVSVTLDWNQGGNYETEL